MLETKRMRLREAATDDIDQIIALEEHKDNRDYLWVGTRQEHQIGEESRVRAGSDGSLV